MRDRRKSVFFYVFFGGRRRGRLAYGLGVGVKKRSDGWSDHFSIGWLWMDGFVQSWMVGFRRRQMRYFFDSLKLNAATVSTCGVCGNMSTGCKLSKRYFLLK